MAKRIAASKSNIKTSFAMTIISTAILFIVTRQIISYGDDYNGLVGLLSSFIAYITIMDSGIQLVSSKKAYKAIRDKDDQAISDIYWSIKKLFWKIGIISLLIVVIFSGMIYYNIINFSSDQIVESIWLIVIIYSLRLVLNYLFVLPKNTLILAAQRGYMVFRAKLIIKIFGYGILILMLYLKMNFIAVIIIWTLITLFEGIANFPVFSKLFNIKPKTKNIKLISESSHFITHKVSRLVADNTDTIIIAAFGSLLLVSIYSVHMFVYRGVKRLITPIINGVKHSVGDLFDVKRDDSIQDMMSSVSISFATISFVGIAIISKQFIDYAFKQGYGNFNYSIMIAAISYMYTADRSSSIAINVTNEFKKTKLITIIEACLNISLSLILINTIFKNEIITGLLVATFAARTIRHIYNYNFVVKNIAGTNKSFIKSLVSAAAVSAVVIINVTTNSIPIYYSSILLVLAINLSLWNKDVLKTFRIYRKG